MSLLKLGTALIADAALGICTLGVGHAIKESSFLGDELYRQHREKMADKEIEALKLLMKTLEAAGKDK